MGDFLALLAGSDMLDKLLFCLRIINILIAAYLTYYMASLSLKKAGKSMGKTFRIMALTFFVMLAIFMIRIFSVLPGWRWDVLEAFTELVFMLAIASVIRNLQSTIDAYEFVSKKTGRMRGME
jgi:phosphatidylglycerophosphate synthase